MNSKPLIVFAGGGTGGHLYPALAVVEWLRDHCEVQYEFICTQKTIDEKILLQWDVPFTTLPVRPLNLKPYTLPGFYLTWKKSLQTCIARFRSRRPLVVVGTGGYGSGPAVKAASRLKIPTALLNPDAIPGRANRYLSRMVNEVYVQWKETLPYFPSNAHPTVTGCPVRKDFQKAKSNLDYERFELSSQLKTLLITGASMGARNINEALILLAPALSEIRNWQVLHFAGIEDEPRIKQAYSESGVAATVRAFSDQMASAFRCADLVVARAGAVTVAELAASSKPAILLPYPYHKDQHQRINAENLVRQGTAILREDLKDPQANAAGLKETLLPLLMSNDQLSRLSVATQTSPSAKAAEVISQHILRLGGISEKT